MRSFGAARVAVTPRLREWETEGLHASLVGSAVRAAATGESRPVACSGRDAFRTECVEAASARDTLGSTAPKRRWRNRGLAAGGCDALAANESL